MQPMIQLFRYGATAYDLLGSLLAGEEYVRMPTPHGAVYFTTSGVKVTVALHPFGAFLGIRLEVA